MRGSSASPFSRRRVRPPAPRSAHSAMKLPSTVVLRAVSAARNSVFQATPQRTPPTTHASPQTRSLPMRAARAARAASEAWPASSTKAPASDCSTGHATNSSSAALHTTTAEATKGSARKAPRRAMPVPSSTSSAAATTKPPQPMPGWPCASAPNAASSAE